MSEPSTIGRNLRRLRNDRGLSQEGLAEAADVSADVIKKLEQGRRQTARITTLTRIANGLDVDLSELVDKRDRMGKDRDGGSVLAVRDALLSPSLLSGIDCDDSGEPTPVEVLARSAGEAWHRYRSGQFGEALAVLPGLIGEARLTHAALGAPAVQPLALAYQTAAELMAQLGRTDLGLVAAERAIAVAHSGDDELLWAWMYHVYSWVLLQQGRHQDAEALVADMAHRIEPSFRDTAHELAVWGNLLLAAVAPAVAQERDPGEYLRLAGAAAERLEHRVSMYESWFAPPAVAMQAAYGYSVLCEPRRALDAAKRIRPPLGNDPGDLEGISWGAHLMDVAHAHLHSGHRRTAATTLLEARAVSPVWFRHQRIAKEVTTGIREQEQRLSPETRTLVKSLSLDE